MERVFLIHGWGGKPEKDWIPWAKEQLLNKGYEAIAPLMPDTDEPQISPWVEKLKGVIGQPKEDDILVGHSIGCQAIWRYLEDLPEGQKVSKVILIAPWMKLTSLEDGESWQIADPWLRTPIDFNKVKTKANLFTLVFSTNDPWVPLPENREMLEEPLGAKVIVLESKGHFSEEEGVKEIPELLDLF